MHSDNHISRAIGDRFVDGLDIEVNETIRITA
jgi:hypothetical protein